MVSFRGNELRVHEGYLAAPIDVHQAIVAVRRGSDARRAPRGAAADRLVLGRDAARARRVASGPAPRTSRSRRSSTLWHERLQRRPLRRRAQVGPGARVAPHEEPARPLLGGASWRAGEIAISWRHLRRHGWEEALHTLLHEMVHQWQDETGRPIDHGRAFRAKAREVGIEAAARRAPGRSPALRSLGGTNAQSAVASFHARFLQHRQPSLRGRARRARQRPSLRRRARAADHRQVLRRRPLSARDHSRAGASSACSAPTCPRSTAARG